MRIKPWVITGSAGVASITALAILVTQNDPMTAPTLVLALFWIALGLSCWSIVATALLAVRAGISRSIAIGGLWTIAGLGIINQSRRGALGIGLLIGILSATLALSVFFWWRMRYGRHS